MSGFEAFGGLNIKRSWVHWQFLFKALSLFWRCKGQSCPLSPDMGLLRTLEDSDRRIGMIILIWIWSLVFGTPYFQILAINLDFYRAKNINVIWVLIWGFGACWRFLTGVWYLDLDSDMVTCQWYTHVQNHGSLCWFWRCYEHPLPLSPNVVVWRVLMIPDWCLASWS